MRYCLAVISVILLVSFMRPALAASQRDFAIGAAIKTAVALLLLTSGSWSYVPKFHRYNPRFYAVMDDVRRSQQFTCRAPSN